MNTKEFFARRVIELRREKGISQSQLADLVGVSKTSANLYESASRVPDIQVLVRYALELEVSADYLLGLSDNKTVEAQAMGGELGLWDDTLKCLKYYEELSKCVRDMQMEYSDEADAMIQEAIANGIMRNNIGDAARQFSRIKMALNDILCDPHLLNALGEYLFSHWDTKHDMSHEEYEAFTLLLVQKHLTRLHESIKELEEII